MEMAFLGYCCSQAFRIVMMAFSIIFLMIAAAFFTACSCSLITILLPYLFSFKKLFPINQLPMGRNSFYLSLLEKDS